MIFCGRSFTGDNSKKRAAGCRWLRVAAGLDSDLTLSVEDFIVT